MNTFYLNYAINGLKISLLFSIAALSFFVARSSLMTHSEMASAITFDLTLTLPILYSIFIRKTRINKLTVIPVFIFGIIFASFILPAGNTRLLDLIKFFALPAVELGVFGYAGFIVYKSRKTFLRLHAKHNDFMENLRETLAAEFPSPALGKAAAFEIAVFYYAFFRWRGEKSRENLFTYHRETGVLALLSIFIFLILAETVVLHLIVANWNAVAAWILTALSAYFVFQIFAHIKATLLRPIKLGENEILLRCGIIGDAQIAYEKIVEIKTIKQPFEKEADAVKITAAGKLTVPNVKIVLRAAEIFNGFYGFEKKFKTIFLAVDQAENFKMAIENKLANKN